MQNGNKPKTHLLTLDHELVQNPKAGMSDLRCFSRPALLFALTTQRIRSQRQCLHNMQLDRRLCWNSWLSQLNDILMAFWHPHLKTNFSHATSALETFRVQKCGDFSQHLTCWTSCGIKLRVVAMALGFRYQMTFIEEVVPKEGKLRSKSSPPVLILSDLTWDPVSCCFLKVSVAKPLHLLVFRQGSHGQLMQRTLPLCKKRSDLRCRLGFEWKPSLILNLM